MNTLTAYFEETGDTPTAMARRLGVAPSTITRIASGIRWPSADLAKRIQADTAGRVTAIALLGLEEPPDIHRRGLRDLGSEASPKQAANG